MKTSCLRYHVLKLATIGDRYDLVRKSYIISILCPRLLCIFAVHDEGATVPVEFIIRVDIRRHLQIGRGRVLVIVLVTAVVLIAMNYNWLAAGLTIVFVLGVDAVLALPSPIFLLPLLPLLLNPLNKHVAEHDEAASTNDGSYDDGRL